MSLTKLTITKIATYDKSRDGVPFMANGRPYTSLRLLTKEKPQNWISGFLNEVNKNWKVGDVVEVEIEQKGEYWNFSMPKKEGVNPQALSNIEFQLKQVYNLLYQIAQKQGVISAPIQYPEEEPNPDDIPF